MLKIIKNKISEEILEQNLQKILLVQIKKFEKKYGDTHFSNAVKQFIHKIY